MIAFGLLDSHTTTAMTNARLDHYVYTRESLAHAKTLLNPGGVVVLSFEAQKPYIADRMARALAEVFGHKPLAFRVPFSAYGWGGVVFVTGDLDAAEAADRRARRNWRRWSRSGKADMPFELPGTTAAATDDWPYIYLESPSVPPLYLLLAAAAGGAVRGRAAGAEGAADRRRVGPIAEPLLLPRGGVHAAGGAEHQQGVGGAGQHLGGERGDHLRGAGDGTGGEPGDGPSAEPAGRPGVRAVDRESAWGCTSWTSRRSRSCRTRPRR